MINLLKDETKRKRLAKVIALQCFRNTKLEDLHSGIGPSSKTGDYSDVKVVTPYSDIPWEHLSRFGDEEMKELMIDVVNHTYTFLCMLADDGFAKKLEDMLEEHDFQAEWNEPKEMYPQIKRMPGNYDSSVDELDGREPIEPEYPYEKDTE